MAADSQATEDSGGVRFEVAKIFELTSRSVCVASGMNAIIDEARASLVSSRELLEASPNISWSIGSIVGPIMKAHYDRFINVPGTQPSSPATSFLACGFNGDDTPFVA